MNRKQLLLLIVLGLLVGGAGVLVSQRRAASWNRTEGGLGQKILGEFPINDITHIAIRSGGAELNLAKDEIWRVKERHGYPANFSEIGDFLRKASELKAVQTVKVGPSNLGRLELVTPEKGKATNDNGILVEFRDKSDKPVKSLLLGKKYVREARNDSQFGGGSFPVGRYVMVPGHIQSVSLVSEPLAEIEPKPESWLAKEWFKVEKIKAVAVSGGTNAWKVARDSETGSNWVLVDRKDGDQVDTNRLSSVGFALSSPSFNDVLAPDTKLDPQTTAILETFEGFVYTVRVGTKTNDDTYPVQVSVTANIVKERTPGKDEKPEDKEKLDKSFQEQVEKLEKKLKQEQGYDKWTYLVSKWTIDPILKERKEFMVEKKDETKADGAAPGAPVIPQLPPGLPGLPDLK